MTGPAICERCGLRMSSYDQVELRAEYRSVAGLRRMRTWRVALICRTCAMEDFERHDHPHGRQSDQGSLL
jgi:hypothetical protein